MLSVAAHPSGSAFASGGSDAKVKLWDLGARACVQTISDHTDQVGHAKNPGCMVQSGQYAGVCLTCLNVSLCWLLGLHDGKGFR